MKAIIVIALIWIIPRIVVACPSCYGAPDAPMTEGLNLALLSLLGITGGVLAAFVSFFVYLHKRTRSLSVLHHNYHS